MFKHDENRIHVFHIYAYFPNPYLHFPITEVPERSVWELVLKGYNNLDAQLILQNIANSENVFFLLLFFASMTLGFPLSFVTKNNLI